MKKITLVIIDGFGTETKEYEKLCISIQNKFKCLNITEILFFTSNNNFKNSDFNIVYTSKNLNYLDLNTLMLQNVASYTDAEKLLFIQLDGYPLNVHLWDEQFLEYDYIGAPWPAGKPWTGDKPIVGNGGFCIRSRKIYDITKNIIGYEDYFKKSLVNEDVCISVVLRKQLEEQGIKFAPVELARKFSVEIPLDDNHTIFNSFGFHGRSHLTQISQEYNESI
jgi:hypothetical protein